MRLLIAPMLLALAAPAAAQVDPSNPGGAPLSPTKGTATEPAQGQVIRDAAPTTANDPANTPRAPSVLNGVEESQRTDSTKPVKGEPPSNDRDPAPVDTGPAPH